MDSQRIVERFLRLYGTTPRLFFAPGRVNLIGEHTDYNDGFVLPMALGLGTIAAAAARPDRRIRVFSTNLNASEEFDLDSPGPIRRGTWLDYVEGVAQALASAGVPLLGADLVVESDLAIGGGLSSSAALEISVGAALTALSGSHIDRVALALAGQSAEHTYVGIRSGIMDQFIATHAVAGHALLIDCRSLESSPVPLSIPGIAVVICDSQVKHTLASSEYNRRHADCESGVELLRTRLHAIRALRDVSPEEFQRHEGILPDSIRRRCRHVISENHRTLAAARAFAAGNAVEAGQLMNESHRSLHSDYEVSCPELDALVASATSAPGCLGARMTGGGFGGCTVNLVRREALSEFCARVSSAYRQTTGLEARIFEAEAGGGCGEVGGRS